MGFCILYTKSDPIKSEVAPRRLLPCVGACIGGGFNTSSGKSENIVCMNAVFWVCLQSWRRSLSRACLALRLSAFFSSHSRRIVSGETVRNRFARPTSPSSSLFPFPISSVCSGSCGAKLVSKSVHSISTIEVRRIYVCALRCIPCDRSGLDAHWKGH
jgi:hypothetical protein